MQDGNSSEEARTKTNRLLRRDEWVARTHRRTHVTMTRACVAVAGSSARGLTQSPLFCSPKEEEHVQKNRVARKLRGGRNKTLRNISPDAMHMHG